jgi:F1F0 ATPase subunit 2
MNETGTLVLTALAGGALGVMYFGGLWWTVRRSLASKRPGLWVFASLLVRMALALAGFYWLGSGRWESMLACLAGFVLARAMLIRMTRLPSERVGIVGPQESRHAP